MDKWRLQLLCLLNLIVFARSTASNSSEEEILDDLSKLLGINPVTYSDVSRFEEFKQLSELILGISNKSESEMSDVLLKNSSRCSADVHYILNHLDSPWALKLIDSFGKPQSGILEGNIKWTGDYDECVDVRVSNPNSTTGNFRGQYCSLSTEITSTAVTTAIRFSTGICVPDSCSEEQLEDMKRTLLRSGVSPVISDASSIIKNISIKCKPTERHLSAPASRVIAALAIFIVLSVVGSSITAVKHFRKGDRLRNQTFAEHTYENNVIKGDEPLQTNYVENHEQRTNGYHLHRVYAFFDCFCIFNNGAKIFKTDHTGGEMTCLHGIRFLSMCWIIIGHTHTFSVESINNIVSLVPRFDDIWTAIAFNSVFGVDSFFVLSGFLLCYLSMKKLSLANGNISWLNFYIHRYLRITPLYMIVLAFYANLFPYLGSGPLWYDDGVHEVCKRTWWTNLLYIHNFNNYNDMCMRWSWYLAVDMQLFVVSPLLLMSLKRWPKIGFSMIGALMCVCWFCIFFLIYHFELAALCDLRHIYKMSPSELADSFVLIYSKPYIRVAPYLIGMITGYVLFKREERGCSKHNLVFLSLGWIFSSITSLTCLFGVYQWDPSILFSSVFVAFNRTGYSLALCWVIYVCLIGQGGLVNTILSFKVFIPLSRITYAVYLIHPMVIELYYESLKTPIEMSHATMLYLSLGFLAATYGVAIFATLILESPVMSLEKLIRQGFFKQKKTK